jgi:hypothetical protein
VDPNATGIPEIVVVSARPVSGSVALTGAAAGSLDLGGARPIPPVDIPAPQPPIVNPPTPQPPVVNQPGPQPPIVNQPPPEPPLVGGTGGGGTVGGITAGRESNGGGTVGTTTNIEVAVQSQAASLTERFEREEAVPIDLGVARYADLGRLQPASGAAADVFDQSQSLVSNRTALPSTADPDYFGRGVFDYLDSDSRRKRQPIP